MWNAQPMVEVWMFAALAEEPILVAWHDLYLKFLNSNDTTVRNETTGEINPVLKGWDDKGVDSGQFKYFCISWIIKVVLAQRPDIMERFNTKAQMSNAKYTVYYVFERWGWNNEKFWAIPQYREEDANKILRDVNPVLKFVGHGELFVDKHYHIWRNLHTNIGYVRMLVARRGRELERINRDWERYGLPLTERT
jgi:hypothetical protein